MEIFMKKFILFFILFSLIIIIHTLLFPVKLFQKQSFFPESFFSLDNTVTAKNIDGYYYSETETGYLALKDGLVNVYKTTEDEYLQANIFGYVTYKKVSDTLSVFSNNRNKIKELKKFGYPYFSGDFPVFYVLKTNGTGFSLYTIQGEELIKEINYTSLITSISTDKNSNTLISNIDGKTFLYSPKGEVLFNTDSDGNDSKIIIAKSSTTDIDGQYIAICSGIDPEYIEIFQKKTGTRIAFLKTDTNFRYKNFMQFDKNRLYYEGIESLKFYDIDRKKDGEIKLTGEIKEIQFDKSGNILVLTLKDNINYLNVFTPSGIKQFYKEIKGEVNNLRVFGNSDFYFKMNNKIIKVKQRKTA
jgi:hypothetical protein